MPLAQSELILNKDGSIYHLNLLPSDVAPLIITVGDPERVDSVTAHFDQIFLSKQKREFKTTTGSYKGKEITVISTGIGTDNIDIVLNELDALFNVDFNTREVKKELNQLTLIRLGTSGSIQTDIDIDSILLSKKAIGFDNLLQFYDSKKVQNLELQQAFVKYLNWPVGMNIPYVVEADKELFKHFKDEDNISGFTATNTGFYGPQGRKIRLGLAHAQWNQNLSTFRYGDERVTNLEMETSGIYGLAKLLGHRALSINAILANRALGSFSENPVKTIDKMIIWALNKIALL